MNGKILVTDSLFIFDEHVKQLEEAGYEVERLDKSHATEEELCDAIKGKVGYILGGIERITDKVIDAADQLKVIAFTGADYKFFIPGWQEAFAKGIKVVTTPGANANAVAEFAATLTLIMQRNLLELGRTGDKKFEETRSLKDSTIGAIGAGNVGRKVIQIVKGFEPSKIIYNSRTKKDGIGAEYVELDALLKQSDVIIMAVPESAGLLLDRDRLNLIKNGNLLINIGSLSLIDMDHLLLKLKAGEVRAAIDWPSPNEEFEKLPLHVWLNTNDHTAYNTHQANKKASDMATESIINILKSGEDKYLVNPEHKK